MGWIWFSSENAEWRKLSVRASRSIDMDEEKRKWRRNYRELKTS